MIGFALAVVLVALAPPVPAGDDALALAQDINAQREAVGRDALQIDSGLSAVALAHAVDMADHGYFGHATLEGISPFARLDSAHVRFNYAGEDLEYDRNVASAEEALWRSLPHRRNALKESFTHIGVAAVRTSQGELFVEEFTG